ncbi:hypothetical protein [Micromonospora sp. NBRC 107095]|uniref:hypothetical protein n=1 Tax=Micromonospora sp. NBRC 107095 TaxID=3032209 RepID=UPI0024A1A2A0|nr:hypothetical protein [Micromonospora sp. NBRC 107095]GLZ62896.1 hypothetical protein Misp05_64720 [Micromonospora sp. NBRC 107095]
MPAIDRFVKRTVLLCAVAAAFALGYNHTHEPCDIGAAGMCVTTAQAGGAR